MRHYLKLSDLSPKDIRHLLNETAALKAAHGRGDRTPLLAGKVLGMVFEKPSLRTRASFEAAMAQMGGGSIFLSAADGPIGQRESVPDFARTLGSYVDAVVLRVFRQQTVEEFAAHSRVPVINGLSDVSHPCQALGDLFTIQEEFGSLPGRTIVFVGDGNNVARSLAVICAKLGAHFILTSPDGFGFDQAFLKLYREMFGKDPQQIRDPIQALRKADVVYTDVWTSMGQEAEREHRLQQFVGYQVNATLLAHAPPHARVMHCLPAHRGEEITDEMMDGERSIVFPQAANRMHVQKALLKWLML
jgi:ornithine carbamoyltransferase